MTRLSPHFTLEELTFSSTAQRLCIDNEPTGSAVHNLPLLAQGLEMVRDLLGDHPIHIDSGYRCPKLNSAIGGSRHSAHMDGYAADFLCHEYGSPRDVVLAVAGSSIPFDQLIFEGSWVHISFATQLRRQVLTAVFDHGRTAYTAGIA